MDERTKVAAAHEAANAPINAGVRIGHVHLKVADLDRALKFYCGVLGFELTMRFGQQAAFISAGGYHHHIGLNTWESLGGAPPPPGTTGLYHLAITASAKRSICAIRTRTASSFTGTARAKSGRARGTASFRCLHNSSI